MQLKPSLVLKLCLFILTAGVFHLSANAQQKKRDSLEYLISIEKNDTSLIKLRNQRNRLLQLDSSIYYGVQNIEAAHQLKFYAGELEARQDLASDYIYKNEFELAKEQLEYLKKFIQPTEDSIDLSLLYSSYGMMYGMQSMYDSSIYYYEKSIGISERNNLRILGSDYSNISIGYQQTGNYSMALEYQQKGLKLAQEQKNENSQAYVLLNMAITYENIGDTAKAEDHYLQSLDLALKLDLKSVETYAYSNLSNLYIDQKKWDKAYDAAMKSINTSGGDLGIRAASYSKAVTALAYTGKYDEAIAMGQKAILYADSSKQSLNICQANSSVGLIYYLQEKYKQAIPYYEKVAEVLKELNIYDKGISNAYKHLSVCYENTGNYAKALANYKIGAEMYDSVTRKDNIRKTTELSMNFDFEKKQQAIAEISRKESERAAIRQYVLLAGLVFVLILGVISYIGYRNKQRANKQLSSQKKQIESTLAELKATQAQLIQSEKMASLGELTAGIAHEIQNPLNFVNNFSELNTELVDELKTELSKGNMQLANEIVVDIKDNSQKINHHGKRADAIVKGMLQHSRSSTGKMELTDINALSDEYLRLSYHGLRAKDKSFNANFTTDFDSSIGKINIVPQDIGRVLLNISNNAFFAVREKQQLNENGYVPTVTVSTKKVNNNVRISIRDNGNGIPDNIKDKIFQPFFTTKPTGSGTGLGLSTSYDIVNAHGGTITVHSLSEATEPEGNEGTGTEFIIELPIS